MSTSMLRRMSWREPGWRLVGLAFALLGVLSLAVAHGVAGGGTVSAQTEGDSPVSVSLRPSSLVVDEGKIGVFTVTATGLAEEGSLELNYSVGPDDDDSTHDVSVADFHSVGPMGRQVDDEYVGTLTLTFAEPSKTIAVSPVSGDGTEQSILESFVVSVTGPDDLSASATGEVNEGVCERSPAIHHWIVDKVNQHHNDGADLGCRQITEAHLVSMMDRSTNIRLYGRNPPELLAHDFRGLERTTFIDMRFHLLSEVGEAAWAGLGSLERLQMGNEPNPGEAPLSTLSKRLTQVVRLTAGMDENTVRLEVVEHAPFQITGELSVVGDGELVVDGTVQDAVTLTIPAGERYSTKSVNFRAETGGTKVNIQVSDPAYSTDAVFYYSFGRFFQGNDVRRAVLG